MTNHVIEWCSFPVELHLHLQVTTQMHFSWTMNRVNCQSLWDWVWGKLKSRKDEANSTHLLHSAKQSVRWQSSYFILVYFSNNPDRSESQRDWSPTLQGSGRRESHSSQPGQNTMITGSSMASKRLVRDRLRDLPFRRCKMAPSD